MADLSKLTIEECIRGMSAGDFSPTDLTVSCLNTIERLDANLNVFVTVSRDEAMSQAERSHKLLKEFGNEAFEKYPLLGIPYACKDNFCTKGIRTTASSRVLESFVPPYESTVTNKLQDAGAVLLGKTNMDAFAHGSSTESSDFFVSKNPYDVKRIPGGSSGGSAVAVASNMCIFAIGSETAGSIRCPASWCGVVGFKPTYGRVSRYGLIAMGSSLDCPGPITKNVWDSAWVLNIIAGKDPLDATSFSAEATSYLPEAQTDFLTKIRLGIPESYFNIDLDSQVKSKSVEFIDLLSGAGAKIIHMDLLDPKYSIAVYTIVQRAEVSSNLARLDGIRYGNKRSAFGFEAKKRMMLGAYTLLGEREDTYNNAQKVRTLIIDDFNRAFDKVDFIISPTMPCTAPLIGESDKSCMFGELMDVLAEPSSIAGLPAVTIPFGKDGDNLPVGVQIIGPHRSERKLIEMAHSAENLCR